MPIRSSVAVAPPAKAVPVLTHPFPTPSVITETCIKPACGKVGMQFKWDGKKSSRVEIVSVKSDTSPFTKIQVGHHVLAVNGIAAITSKQTAALIREAESEVTLTAMAASSPYPYCKLVAAPIWRHHPGIQFDATRGRCLVQVSRLFSKGPFAGSALQEGDIVLAIDGITISKVEDADRALYLARSNPFMVLHVVDMKAYRESVYEELRTTSAWQRIAFKESNDPKKHTRTITLAASEANASLNVPLAIDTQNTQHLVDPNPHLRLHPDLMKEQLLFRHNSNNKKAAVKCAKLYETAIVPFLQAFNDGMEKRMRCLEEAVICQVWQDTEMLLGRDGVTSCSDKDARGRTVSDENLLPVASVEDYEYVHPLPFAQAEIQILPMRQQLEPRSC